MDSHRKKPLRRISRLLRESDNLEREITTLACRDVAEASRCAGLLEEWRRILSQLGDDLLDGAFSDEQIAEQLAELDGALALLGLDVCDEHDDDDDEHDDEHLTADDAREVGAFLERELRPRLIAILHARAGDMDSRQFTRCIDQLCCLEVVMNRLQGGDAPDDEQALDHFLDAVVNTFSEAKEAE
jgi:hypothetical protein